LEKYTTSKQGAHEGAHQGTHQGPDFCGHERHDLPADHGPYCCTDISTFFRSCGEHDAANKCPFYCTHWRADCRGKGQRHDHTTHFCTHHWTYWRTHGCTNHSTRGECDG
jgi:hypothetical protein